MRDWQLRMHVGQGNGNLPETKYRGSAEQNIAPSCRDYPFQICSLLSKLRFANIAPKFVIDYIEIHSFYSAISLQSSHI